jgi:hypothetical protein
MNFDGFGKFGALLGPYQRNNRFKAHNLDPAGSRRLAIT